MGVNMTSPFGPGRHGMEAFCNRDIDILHEHLAFDIVDQHQAKVKMSYLIYFPTDRKMEFSRFRALTLQPVFVHFSAF
jgi:hypothetical protein